MSKTLSAKYYQQNKERVHKRKASERYQYKKVLFLEI